MLLVLLSLVVAGTDHVPLYRVWEKTVTNKKVSVENKFRGVTLNTTFVAPSGAHTPFWGFYDGDDAWTFRFMANEPGHWTYNYTFSDGSMQGEGSFDVTVDGRSPGVIQPYRANPHWFAYNGDEPVFIKSYYNKAGGFTRQNATWAGEHFYSKLAGRGYNHHMASGFLPVLPLTATWDGSPFLDAPPAIPQTIYTDPADPSTSMRLDVWECLEGHLSYMNDHDIALDFFQGFNAQGPGAGPLTFKTLPADMKEWWVSYVVARLSPFANVAGYVYSWESHGNDTKSDLLLAQLLGRYDPFRHMVTYEEQDVLKKNHFDLPEWSFASVEASHSVQNTHDITLAGYVGKPVYMCEGHSLWLSWWGAAESDVPRAAWAVTTAGGSFTWNDMGNGTRGNDTYSSGQVFTQYPSASLAIDVLHHVMTEVLPAFHRMVPADASLPNAPSMTWCLAEAGAQYLVYSDSGKAFQLNITGESVFGVTWIDPVKGTKIPADSVHGGVVTLSPPSSSHWVAAVLKA